MMAERTRLRLLNETLAASEAEAAQIEHEIAAHHDNASDDIEDLKRRW
jgi:hypothetical protein